MSRFKLDAKNRAAIRSEYSRRKSLRLVAERFGCSPQTVFRAVHDMNRGLDAVPEGYFSLRAAEEALSLSRSAFLRIRVRLGFHDEIEVRGAKYWSPEAIERIRRTEAYRKIKKSRASRSCSGPRLPHEKGKVCSTCRFLSETNYCLRHPEIGIEIEDARHRTCGCWDYRPVRVDD